MSNLVLSRERELPLNTGYSFEDENQQDPTEDDFMAFADAGEEPEELEDDQENHPEAQEEYYEEEPEQAQETLDPEEAKNRKMDLLISLENYYKQGYQPSRHLDMTNSLEDIETEVTLIKKRISVNGGLQICRGLMMSCINGIEALSTVYNPDSPLVGWSKQEYTKLDSYDQVLSEIYLKWSPRLTEWGPEITLLLMLTFSATNHVMSVKSSKTEGNPNWMDKLNDIKDSEEFGGPSQDVMDEYESFMNSPEPAKKPRKPRKKKESA
jgi:Family of unknown function (DUF5767)